MAQLFDREVSLYLSVLEKGQADGAFRLSQPALNIARNLVALEDAYGFHLLAKTSSVDAMTALDALFGYARTATRADLLDPAGPAGYQGRCRLSHCSAGPITGR